jgi:hypothetical protein
MYNHVCKYLVNEYAWLFVVYLSIQSILYSVIFIINIIIVVIIINGLATLLSGFGRFFRFLVLYRVGRTF